MTQSPMAGLVAQGPLPAGMLRIHQGNQEQYVWPVHLPGWLALGWRVAGTSSTATEPLPQAVPAPAVPRDSEAELTAGRGKRGRRRKEEPEQPTAGFEATPEETGTTAEAGATDLIDRHISPETLMRQRAAADRGAEAVIVAAVQSA